MSKPKDLTGHRFGRLVVIKELEPIVTEYTYRKHVARVWKCLCDCGNFKNVRADSLQTGNTKSCGCLQKDFSKKSVKKAFGVLKNDYLREGTSLVSLDRKMDKNNTSGVKGVSYDKNRKKWAAYIGFKKELRYLGRFSNKQDAINARKEAEEEYFKPLLEKYDYRKNENADENN